MRYTESRLTEVARLLLEGIDEDAVDFRPTYDDSGREPVVLPGALADATQRPVEVSPVVEATTLGAAFLAGLASGAWSGWDDIASTWRPARTVTPARKLDRDQWRDAVERSRGWFGDLSSLEF